MVSMTHKVKYVSHKLLNGKDRGRLYVCISLQNLRGQDQVPVRADKDGGGFLRSGGGLTDVG